MKVVAVRDLEMLLKDSERIRRQSDALVERLKTLIAKVRKWYTADSDTE